MSTLHTTAHKTTPRLKSIALTAGGYSTGPKAPHPSTGYGGLRMAVLSSACPSTQGSAGSGSSSRAASSPVCPVKGFVLFKLENKMNHIKSLQFEALWRHVQDRKATT